MTRKSPHPGRRSAALVLAGALATPGGMAVASDIGPNTSTEYVKECGACHFPYQPGFLPARSWQRIMAGLDRHFGDHAELDAGPRASITAYLVAGSADTARNPRSREVMSTLRPADTPVRVTEVLYVGGIHGGFLDPQFMGTPAVKTLADCAACHPEAIEGRFAPRSYVISDARFRVLSGD